jgi:hypothetical protein
MKKLITSIFILTYFVTSTGAAVQLHYCMNELVSWDVNGKTKANCGECGMEKQGHKGCCHDENKLIKIEKDHKVSSASFDFLQLPAPLHTAMNVKQGFTPVFNIITFYPSAHAPPKAGKVPIYLFNSLFRI